MFVFYVRRKDITNGMEKIQVRKLYTHTNTEHLSRCRPAALMKSDTGSYGKGTENVAQTAEDFHESRTQSREGHKQNFLQ